MKSTSYIAFIVSALFGIVIPLVVVLATGIPLPQALSFAVSAYLLEALAVPIGFGLGLPPFFIGYMILSVAFVSIVFLIALFDEIGEHSPRLARFISRSRERAESSRSFQKYGVYSLAPLVLMLGTYVCTSVAWVAGWHRTRAATLMLAVYSIYVILLVFGAMGVITLLT